MNNSTTPIHPKTQLGHVHYTVADLDAQTAFYQNILGFTLLERQGDTASLGTSTKELLRLTQNPEAQPARGTTGLYHTAFLLPTRWDLAHLLKNIAEAHIPIQGTANHSTHHAIYLPDAEGNGIELAWDFPKDQWPKTAQEMFSANRGLSTDEIFSAIQDQPGDWPGLPDNAKVGHVHLHVAHIPPAETFYHHALGFDIPLDFKGMDHPIANTALFFSAGGYHHHIGTNTW